jgi:hypothetical protein
MRLCFSLTLLALHCGCGGGRLLILLEPPSVDQLNPLKDTRLTKYSLRVSQAGQVTDQEAVRTDVAELSVGTVPTGEPFDLRLAAKSAADEMLGLGFVRDVRAAETGESSVKVYFRKPVAYVGGRDRVIPLNTAAGSAEAPELGSFSLPGISRVTDVAATPNGAWVLVAADSSLVPVLTSNHSVLEKVTLKAPVSCVAVSPDSRYAVVCHKTGVSVVDLARIGTPDVPYRTVEVTGGEPMRVVFGADRRTAHVLANAMPSLGDCPGTPSLLGKLDVDAPDVVVPDNLQQAVADIAVDPRDGGLLLALPCAGAGALGRLRNNVAEVLDVRVPAPYDIAIAEKSFLVAGRMSGTSEGMRVVRFDLTTPGFNVVDDRTNGFPPLELGFRNISAGSGYLSWASEPAKLRIHHLAVSPDARRAVAMFRVDYSSDLTNVSCQYRAKSQADGYMILDLAASAIVFFSVTQLRVDDCYSNCLATSPPQQLPFTDPAVCKAEYKRVIVKSELELAASSLLFGG